MIDGAYKKFYNTIFQQLLTKAQAHSLDECALPSYTHTNKMMAWLFWRRIHTALKMCGNLEYKKVLDFGCGAGVCFKYLAEQKCTVVGCDNQYSGLAQSLCGTIGIKATVYDDITAIPDDDFDLVLALDVLEHVDDLTGFIKLLKSKVKRGALIVISGPTENQLYKFGRFLAGFTGEYHKRNIYDIEQELKNNFLDLVQLARLYPPIPLFRISKWTIKKEEPNV